MSQLAPTEQKRGSAVEVYAASVMGDEERTAELFRALPAHVPAERFKRNLLNALMQNPDMLKYDPRFVYREVSKAAALGLLLDPQLGEAYIVPVWNAKAGRAEPQLRVGYRGIMKLSRQSGEISSIYAHEVHENDEVDCDLGADKRLIHKPLLFGDRGRVVGYYAVVKFKDGETDFEPMTLEQIHAIRDKSEGWRAFKAGKIKSTPWATDEGEMAKKTVIKRLLKRVPQSPDLATAMGLENDAPAIESAKVIDLSSTKRRPAPRTIESRLDAFAAPETDDEPPAEVSPDASADSEASNPTLQEAQQPAPSDATSSPAKDGAGELPPKIADAMAKGRAACIEGYPREVPKALAYKTRAEEAEAFLQGWDAAAAEADAAEAVDQYTSNF